MTEQGELTIMDLCEEAGQRIAPCEDYGPTCRNVSCAWCAGTGVDPDVLTVLYELATDAADLAKREALLEVSALLQYRAHRDTGAGN